MNQNNTSESSLESFKRLLYFGTNEGMRVLALLEEPTAPKNVFDMIDEQHLVGNSDYCRRIVNRELRAGRCSRNDFRRGWVDVILEMVFGEALY